MSVSRIIMALMALVMTITLTVLAMLHANGYRSAHKLRDDAVAAHVRQGEDVKEGFAAFDR